MEALRLASASLALVLLAACSGPQTPPSGTGGPEPTTTPTATEAPTSTPTATASPEAGDTVAPPYVLTVHQNGGIAGLHMETVIDAGAKKITYGGLKNQKVETQDLSPDEVAAITAALQNAKVSSFPGLIKGPPVADAFGYTIVVETAGRTHRVEWADGATVPDPILAVRVAVTKLRETKFKPGAPAGAPSK